MAEKKVKVHIPKGVAGDDSNLYVCVNGEACLLPRGKTSEVSPAIAAEIERSQRAQERYDEKAAEQKQRAAAPTNQPNA